MAFEIPKTAYSGKIKKIKLGKGAVEVKPAGGGDWRPAGPLMSLLGGDTVRASGGGSAVILLTGGRGTIRVRDATSPCHRPFCPCYRATQRRELTRGALRACGRGPSRP